MAGADKPERNQEKCGEIVPNESGSSSGLVVPFDHRLWTRNTQQGVKAVVKLVGGACIEGITRDVSLTGAFVESSALPATLSDGEKGTIELVTRHQTVVELPCRVARIASDGVGIVLYDTDASLGIALSCDLLDLLIGIASAVSTSLELNETLRSSIAHMRAFLHTEAASLFLLDDSGTWLVCRACVGPVNILGVRISVHDGIVGRAVREMKPQIIENVSFDHGFTEKVDRTTGFVTRSVLCVPLQIQGKPIGAMEVLNKYSGAPFDAKDQYLLSALAATASLAIYKARHVQEMIEQERRRNELLLARTIQETFLPPTRGHSFPVHGLNIPALEVSGDFFDIVELAPGGPIFFVLGDVSGKGAKAGLLMAKANSLIRYLAKTGASPGQVLSIVNQELADAARIGMFVTVVAGVYDPHGSSVRLANAGHHPVLIYHRQQGQFRTIGGLGLPLGILKEQTFEEVEIDLRGCSLYCYSDGITEAIKPAGGMWNEEGLRLLLREYRSVPAAIRLSSIVARIRWEESPLHDDLTMVLVEDLAAL